MVTRERVRQMDIASAMSAGREKIPFGTRGQGAGKERPRHISRDTLLCERESAVLKPRVIDHTPMAMVLKRLGLRRAEPAVGPDLTHAPERSTVATRRVEPVGRLVSDAPTVPTPVGYWLRDRQPFYSPRVGR